MNNKFENGSVKISNDIFYMISAIATNEVEGVKCISGLNTEIDKINAKNSKKFMEINFHKEGITVSVKVIVLYGNKLDEVSLNIQENIKNKIEAMTGIKVMGVNVTIDSIEK